MYHQCRSLLTYRIFALAMNHILTKRQLRMLKDLRLDELKTRQAKDMKYFGPKYDINA